MGEWLVLNRCALQAVDSALYSCHRLGVWLGLEYNFVIPNTHTLTVTVILIPNSNSKPKTIGCLVYSIVMPKDITFLIRATL